MNYLHVAPAWGAVNCSSYHAEPEPRPAAHTKDRMRTNCERNFRGFRSSRLLVNKTVGGRRCARSHTTLEVTRGNFDAAELNARSTPYWHALGHAQQIA